MTKQIVSRFTKVLLTTSYYLLVAFPIVVSAADVTLQWDTTDPVPDGYHLYMRLNGEAFNYSSALWSGSATTYQVQDLTPGTTYYFVVRAYVGDEVSSNSNELAYTPPAGVSGETTDNDADGIDNSVDAFPDDPTEWLDTDNDGIGNNADTDDDGDGMPDSWEAQYIGLNPLIDDALNDLDGDGVTNLDEYQADSDPSEIQGNTAPDRPVLVAPADESVVELTPTLITGTFADPDGDAHGRTQYQIATENDFSAESLVFDHVSEDQLGSMTVVDLVLEPDAGYYWRVRFFDEHNSPSEWSEASFFTTESYEDAGDVDGDGVFDHQQVNTDIDMDGDGIADTIQDGILSVSTPCPINPWIAVKRNADDVHVVAIKAYAATGFGPADNQPEQLTGVVSFKLHLDPGVTEASVTIYFHEPAPADAHWYKFDVEDGWRVYSHADFSADRRSVTIALQDGGTGDQDGVRNGIIVDPAGLGFTASNDDGTYSETVVGAGAGGCFIGSPMNELTADIVMPDLFNVLIVSLCLVLLMLIFRWSQMKRPD